MTGERSLVYEFVSEAKEHLANVTDDLLALEKAPEDAVRFRIDRLNAQFRILVDNITDRFSWALTSGGGFKVDVGRRVTGYVAVDL